MKALWIIFVFFAFWSISEATHHKKNQLICIDSGHGGTDFGALSEAYGYEEKQLTLSTALLVKNYLQKLGYKVIMTRSQDVFVSLQDRADLANNKNAALFVSVHFNFCQNDSAQGVEVYYCKEQGDCHRIACSKQLAEEVLSRIIKHTGAVSRGVRTANFLVIKRTSMPSILVEGGFLSNKEERQKIKDPRYLNFIAWGIARGVDHYLSG